MPVPELAVPRLWASAAPTSIPRAKQRRVAVAFPGHEELAAGAAAREREGEPGGDHAEVVPHKVAVGHGLAFKAELEAAGQGVGDEGGGEHGREPEEKVGVAEKEEIAESPHRAEAAALRDDPDDEGQPQRGDERRVLRARPLHGVEEGAALRFARNLRERRGRAGAGRR